MNPALTVAVIGAGPAGMLAAAYAAKNGLSVDLIDRNEKVGKKLFITGKGRCNITNMAEKRDFMEHITRNPKFLLSAFSRFFNTEIVELLNSEGVETKVERGERVFPASNKSSDVIRALHQFALKQGVKILLETEVQDIKYTEGKGFLIEAAGKKRHYDALVIATGGLSYPSTGSTGDGYRFAQSLGHTLIEPKASLIHLLTEEAWPGQLTGLSLKNVRLSALQGKKRLYEDLGEMIFTHQGIGGPLVLSATSFMPDKPRGTQIEIDLKPGLTQEELDARVLRDFAKHKTKLLKNALVELLPQRLIPVVIQLSKLDENKCVDAITRQERQALVSTLKSLPVTVKKLGPLEDSVITRGGISVKEIDSKTMESKLVKRLYFAGEIMDLDATTGGYNLQIAYSTGVAAGSSIC